MFQEAFDALEVSVRAALVFRYREDLSLAHVAQLVGRRPEQISRAMEQALTALMESGALPHSAGGAEPGPCAAEGELRFWLEKLSEEPALSSFALVLAVREQQQRQRFWNRGR